VITTVIATDFNLLQRITAYCTIEIPKRPLFTENKDLSHEDFAH